MNLQTTNPEAGGFMPEAFQAIAAIHDYARCCRCGAVEVPLKGTLDKGARQTHALEVLQAVRRSQWFPALGTAEALKAYATQLQKAGWHISRFHPTEASLCPRCWAVEERACEHNSRN